MTKKELLEKEKTYFSFFQKWHERITAYLSAAKDCKTIQFGHLEYDDTDPKVIKTKVDACECPPSEERFDRILALLKNVQEALKEKNDY